MPSLSAQKLIRKLRQRKYRWQEALFVAEGPKLVQDLIDSGLKAQSIWSTTEFPESEAISPEELKKLSHLSTPNQVLALFPFPPALSTNLDRILILDGINDPGNLGTLLRTADWFGFRKVICTEGTADVYNAKTVQSTMGSLARLDISYDSIAAIQSALADRPIYVAEMTGRNFKELHTAELPELALVMGSESHGPSAEWQEKGAQTITINRPQDSQIDSLNVGIAGGILMQHLAR